MFEITLTMGMRQCTLDCYRTTEQSACLTQASKFYIALNAGSRRPVIVCNGSRIVAYRVSANAPLSATFLRQDAYGSSFLFSGILWKKTIKTITQLTAKYFTASAT